MKRIVAAVVLMLAAANATAGDPRVENVRARQIPDTKDVEVVYDLVAPDGGLFKVSAIFQAPGVAPEVKTVTGDFGSNVAPGRNRRFVWDAGADWPNSVNRSFTCTVGAEEQDPNEPLPVDAGVQLWAGGPYWAECNVGASKPEESGLYFMWGYTVGDARIHESSSNDSKIWGMTYFQLQVLGYIGIANAYNLTAELTAEHDAATAHLGAPWRMPTKEEFSELRQNCTMKVAERNGVRGLVVMGKGDYALKSIFLPALDGEAVGHYWSSSARLYVDVYTHDFGFYNSAWGFAWYAQRDDLYDYSCYALSLVRPVRDR